MYRGRIKRIHFIGIGGSGMNGIAEVLMNMGYKVTGSDLAESETTRRLKKLGAVIHIGHREDNVRGADCVVYSSAVRKDNPELKEASSRQTPIIPRAEMLAELMRLKYGIAIAGTHGKTTTTSMISMILAAANMDPTIVTGGKLNSLGANARLGTGDFLVAEADESDGSFLKLSPTIAVVTNIDREHMDHYRSMDDVKEAYLNFMNKVPFYGCAVICLDHPVIQGLIPAVSRRFITYGLSAQSDIHAGNLRQNGMETSFEVWYGRTRAGSINLRLPGEHNVYNALAAAAVGRSSRSSGPYCVPMMVTIGKVVTMTSPTSGRVAACATRATTRSPRLVATSSVVTWEGRMRWWPPTSSNVDMRSCLPWTNSVLKKRQSGPSTTAAASRMAFVAR